MSAGTTPAFSLAAPPQRKVPRYKLTVPLNLTVLRSGVPDSIQGQTLELSEGGIGVVAASRLLLGESVRVEFLLPHMTTPVRATAVVRYEHERAFGLQFLRLPVEQQSIIRYWTRCEGEVLLAGHKLHPSSVGAGFGETLAGLEPLEDQENSALARPSLGVRRMVAIAATVLLVTAMLAWWRWQQGWTELEGRVLANQPAAATPQLRVPEDVMQRRLVHKVMPEYPDGARQAGVQGTVVLDVVVDVEGAVTQVKVVSGPEALSHAAADAVRWWRYEPYLVNGQPATVESSVSMDFRLGSN